ncbi:hypothetical protein LDENG_00096290 [Lucifuga dentata]|nr:hypothetical protein LDENG_00096290 [Lucifuga dentata]
MASKYDLSCSICHDVFKEPVVLSCSHSFCKVCLQSWWAERPTHDCPLCNRRSSTTNPPVSLVVKNLCKAFLLEREQKASVGPEPVCRLHAEKFKLFCLAHQQPVCLVCRDSEKHATHNFRPIDEAAWEHKEKLQTFLKILEKKLELCTQVKANYDQTAEHNKVQARCTERQIKEEFKKLHQFLLEEEEARISVLREEEEQKNKMVEEETAALSIEMTLLSDAIRATEAEMKADDVSFLQNYMDTEDRVHKRLQQPDTTVMPGALIDVVKHVGNLSFNVWVQMKEMVSYTPVVLDPNTAFQKLILSEDLTSVRCGETQQVPENPERFNKFMFVVGSEGFNSGTHSWDVEVGDCRKWMLGVVSESFPKKGVEGIITSEYFQIYLNNGEYRAFMVGAKLTVLCVNKRFQRVRVHLDWKRGRLSFSDPDSNKNIHTFKYRFMERLFPYIGSFSGFPLKILAAKVHVTVAETP